MKISLDDAASSNTYYYINRFTLSNEKRSLDFLTMTDFSLIILHILSLESVGLNLKPTNTFSTCDS